MSNIEKHKTSLKEWQKAVKTLKSGEPVQVDGVTLHPELQKGQHELDMKSAERMVEICERRIKNAKLKATGNIELDVNDFDGDVEGKAYIMAKERGISDEVLAAIYETMVVPRANVKKIKPVLTIRDINVYVRKGLPEGVKVEAKKPAVKDDKVDAEKVDEEKAELDGLRAKCKELGVDARGGKVKLEKRIADALKPKEDAEKKAVNPLA